jgi:hypothetical protein
MKNNPIRAVVCCLSLMAVIACAGRQPTVARSQKILHKHFVRYGKLFPKSIYHENGVTNVAILDTEELHKHYLHVTADVTLTNGSRERVRAAVQKKLPFGWRLVAWESVTASAENASPPPSSRR